MKYSGSGAKNFPILGSEWEQRTGPKVFLRDNLTLLTRIRGNDQRRAITTHFRMISSIMREFCYDLANNVIGIDNNIFYWGGSELLLLCPHFSKCLMNLSGFIWWQQMTRPDAAPTDWANQRLKKIGDTLSQSCLLIAVAILKFSWQHLVSWPDVGSNIRRLTQIPDLTERIMVLSITSARG